MVKGHLLSFQIESRVLDLAALAFGHLVSCYPYPSQQLSDSLTALLPTKERTFILIPIYFYINPLVFQYTDLCFTDL